MTDNDQPEVTGKKSEFVDPTDLTLQRDGEGERIPQVMEVGELGKMKILPMNYGDVQAYLGDGQQHTVESQALAELFNDFVIEPDLSKAADMWAKETPGYSAEGRVTPAWVEDLKPLVPRDILLALLDASGIDADVIMQGPGQAQVNVEEGN